ncbi:DNA-directed RNA polymerase, omega subunit [Treponema lecithinolyticum ATCC 700332]|uniref:DNA-directed RNA polymerase subunit omega n=2 Tax=Treponema lecithinolyticum TaxID=53418 RepID=A0ABN0NZ25_TRELE|nr:DNA-directed RNA polymerase, omega subunit [Treponema lecithinolyticum ATCC 700332]
MCSAKLCRILYNGVLFMIFPLEELVQFTDNIYEITCAASRRAYQLSMVKDAIIEENDGKVVSLAARQLFSKQVEYRIEA